MILNLFDNTLDYFEKEKFTLKGITRDFTVSDLISKSRNLLSSDYEIIGLMKEIKHYETDFGTISRVSGESIYIFEEKKIKVLFEFGEKQPGRYILNQLAIIEE